MIHINMGGYRSPTPPADEAGDRQMQSEQSRNEPTMELSPAAKVALRHSEELQRVKTLAYADGVAAGRKQAAADIRTAAADNSWRELAARIAEGGKPDA